MAVDEFGFEIEDADDEIDAEVTEGSASESAADSAERRLADASDLLGGELDADERALLLSRLAEGPAESGLTALAKELLAIRHARDEARGEAALVARAESDEVVEGGIFAAMDRGEVDRSDVALVLEAEAQDGQAGYEAQRLSQLKRSMLADGHTEAEVKAAVEARQTVFDRNRAYETVDVVETHPAYREYHQKQFERARAEAAAEDMLRERSGQYDGYEYRDGALVSVSDLIRETLVGAAREG